MDGVLAQLREQFVTYGPTLLAGLVILVVGWLVALLAAFVVRKLLGKTALDNRIAGWMSSPDRKTAIPIEQWAGKAVFWLVMLIALVAFVTTIHLTAVAEPLNKVLLPFLDYLPRLVGAGVLILVAWVIATVLRNVTAGVLKACKLDEKAGGAAQGDPAQEDAEKPLPLSDTFAGVVYWLVFLLFMPLILDALNMQALLAPLTTLLNKAFAFLPNLISAAAILAVGWFIARIVQRLVTGLLAGVGVDRASEKWGLAASLGKQKLSGVLGLVLYFVILVPVFISALAALQLEAITKPASDMLGKVMSALPNLFGAALVVLIGVVIGKVVAGLVTNLLAGMGFNHALIKLGLAKQVPEGKPTLAGVAGMLAMVFVILLASVTAAEMLGFPTVGVLIHDFISFAGHVLMGALVFGLGLLLAQMVAKAVLASDSPNAPRLALLARVVILALAGAMALRQTGVADDIVNLAFGLTLGAAAVAFALAFGLGGRDMAARTLNQWQITQTKPMAKASAVHKAEAEGPTTSHAAGRR